MEAQLDKIYEKLDSSGQTKPDQVLKVMKDANLVKASGQSEDEVMEMLTAGAENEKVSKSAFKEIAAALMAGVSGATKLVEQMLNSLDAQTATTSQAASEALGNAAQQAAGVFGEVTDRVQGAMGQGKK